MSEVLAFKAHARLLTMLGEQLIKNERIALVELVKNSYDADATLVEVDFVGFNADFTANPGATITITDNGTGMPENVVRTVWMNPATPSKAITKHLTPRTSMGRVLQGEKGIGRFATFKLGSQLALTTRAERSATETTLLIDISDLDVDESSRESPIDYYLDEVGALLDVGLPEVFVEQAHLTHGTRLEIGGLRAHWNETLVRDAFSDLDRIQPLMWNDQDSELRADFVVRFLRDGIDLRLGAERNEEFLAVLERAVLRVKNGHFDDVTREFRFTVNDRPIAMSIDDPEVRGLRLFRQRFLAINSDSRPNPACGPFEFEFFIFDFNRTAPAQFSLDGEEKKLLESHRIYLYRDGIRVYPYGDAGDDWLQVDVIRGTQSARSMFSNDQTVGFVKITQADNPLLRDKTNREGLLETGNATGDFVALIQTVLSYLRAKPYEQYAAANRRARERQLDVKRVDKHVEALRNDVRLPPSARAHLDDLESAVQAERSLASLQVARTEQLAGVGLSVETASHDLIAAGTEALRIARQVVSELKLLDLIGEPVYVIAASLVTRLEFISARFQDVQGLFVSTRQKQAKVDVIRLVRRVGSMYGSLHASQEIEFDLDSAASLSAVTTEGALLQCLINLVDNATYWLMASPHRPRVIRVFCLDDRTLVISDSGAGVRPQDEPFIFEPFYSGKGDAGKGLGLYIARQNGLRSGFEVDLESPNDARVLGGATFVVRFGAGEDAQ